MKLKYIFLSLVAALTMVSCSEDDDKTFLSSVQVSQSFVGLDSLGTPVKITLSANADWAFEKLFEKVVDNGDNTKDTILVETPDWLTVDVLSGAAGVTEITFSGKETTESNSATLKITCAGETQIINVIQTAAGAETPLSTCAEVIAGPDSKTYRVKGTVKSIANTTYGNWYLEDETGVVYIYGTLDAKGATKNFSSLGLEVGDIVTVEGPKTTYNGTVELVDVTVISIEKSLIKVESLSADEIVKDGGDIVARLSNKGAGYTVEIEEAAQDWLFIKSFAADSVILHAIPNAGGDRSAVVTFKTSADGKDYTAQVTVVQKGAIIEASIQEFLDAEVGDTQYRVTGIITNVANATYGNVNIRDFSGEAYVYGIGARGDFETLGLKAGDIVTLVGKRGAHDGNPQMTGAVCESSKSVIEVTIDEFLTKEDATDVYYKVSGDVDEIANATYGNLYLKSGEKRLYVYGTYPGWGATGDFRKNFLATEGIEVGDKLTVIGVKSTHNDVPQVNGGLYFSHEKAAE